MVQFHQRSRNCSVGRLVADLPGCGLRLEAPNPLQGGLVDLLLCSQLSGHIPRPPKGGAAAEATEGFYSIFTDPRKVCYLMCLLLTCIGDCTVCDDV
jgi:hypothetical protein